MKQKRLYSLLLPALALCMGSLPATAGILFSDLGPPGNVYDCCAARAVYGSGAIGTSYIEAALFTVAGTGSLPVTGIDLAVSHGSGPNTFDASIWTDSGGLPGLELASWLNLSTTTPAETCCGLVSISGISGVTLTGGQEYFMVLGPVSLADNSVNLWAWNTQGVSGESSRYSTDGGATWNSWYPGEQEFAFAITSTPEPGSLLLLGTGLIGILAVRGRKRGPENGAGRGTKRTRSEFLAVLALGTILLTAPARAATLYTNGPVSGQIGGLSLYGGNQATDSFTLSGPGTILNVTFGEWVVSGATPEAVDWQIGSSAFGSDLDSATGVPLTLSLFCTAGGGCGDGAYDVYTSGFTLDLPLAGGTYWLTLQNATTSAGLVFWDQSGGPSLVSTTGFLTGYLSNSFTITGVPEPGSVWLGGSVLLLVFASGLRRPGRHFPR